MRHPDTSLRVPGASGGCTLVRPLSQFPLNRSGTVLYNLL